MTKIAVLDDWQGVARTSADWSALEARAKVVFFPDAFANEDDAAHQLADFDIVLSMRERTPLPASLINRLPRLRMLGMTGGRNASLDTDACTARGIPVCATTAPAGSTNDAATAELALGLMIAAARGLAVGDANVRAGKFQMGVPVGIGLKGKTLGLVGLGRLGSYMAQYGNALGMKVIGWSQNLTEDKAKAAGATMVSKHDLMSRADVVSIHLVLSPRSRGLIGAADIALMQHGAILVNTSRGPIVDEAALLERRARGKNHCGAGRLRTGAAAARRPDPQRAQHRADAASRLLCAGDVGAVLPAKRRERAGVPGRQAGPRHQSGRVTKAWVMGASKPGKMAGLSPSP